MEIAIYLIVALAGLGGGYTLAMTAIRKSIEKKSEQLVKDAEAEAEVLKKRECFKQKRSFCN